MLDQDQHRQGRDALEFERFYSFEIEEKPMAETTTKVPVEVKRAERPTRSLAEWRPFDSLRRDIDRLFDDFWLGPWRSPLARRLSDAEPFWRSEITWSKPPAVDVAETENGYEVTAELPGIEERNIDVKVADGILTIKGERQEQKEEKKKDYFVSERHYGSFQRSFTVPNGVDTDKIEAHFKNGILTVNMPKSVQAQKSEKKIEIKKAAA
jgi:HSP20 family protein